MDSGRPVSLKSVQKMRLRQDVRRAAALERQRAHRQISIDHARRLGDARAAVEVSLPEGQQKEEAETNDLKEQAAFMAAQTSPEQHQMAGARQSMREYFAGQLMQHEWMTDAPQDLGQNWIVLPRPEGQRCLIIASKGRTVSYSKKGVTVHRFPSLLPGGSAQTGAKADAITVLDCIYSHKSSSYIVMDIMCWAGYQLYDCKSEFRMYWLHSKMQELPQQGKCGGKPFCFTPVPFHQCSTGGLQAAYAGPVAFRRDGLLFLHKEGHYDLGTSPLGLLWKDASSSRYFIETDAKGDIPTQQTVVLRCLPTGQIGTGDEPPCQLGPVPASLAQAESGHLKPGQLLQFTVGEGGLQLDCGELVAAHLIPVGQANQHRGHADISSKIVFQHMARHQPLTVDMLLASVSSSTAGLQEDVVG